MRDRKSWQSQLSVAVIEKIASSYLRTMTQRMRTYEMKKQLGQSFHPKIKKPPA
jgi:hypothetical protein